MPKSEALKYISVPRNEYQILTSAMQKKTLVVSFFAMFVRSAEMRSSRIIDQTFLLTQTIGTMSQLTSHKNANNPLVSHSYGTFA